MYVDGWMLLAIYFIAVLALAVSAYALWALEEIRLHYKRYYNQRIKQYNFPQPASKKKSKSYWSQ